VHGVQPDTDGDGYGNRCDCDYNNNGTVDIEDVGLFSQFFGAADPEIYGDVGTSEIAWGEERYVELGGQEIVLTPELADHNANGRVDLDDFDALHADFGQEPGPSNDL
jgi:hypothetical protein